MEFLKTKFGPGKPIFTEDAEPLGLSAGNLRQQFKKLVDSGELFRYEPGVYFLPDPNHEYYSISSNMVAEYKYITDGDEIYGYYSGYTFANQLGLCLQVPYKEEIATSSFVDEFYKEKDDPELSDEATAIEEMFEHYDELGFIGGLLYQNGEPVAFTAGTRLDNEVFDVHFEKALTGVEGGYTMVNREFARMIHAELPGIIAFNREEDMGIEGLRKAKESYHPDVLLMKYFAKEK